MRERSVLPLLKQRLRTYPAVALVGPRQCGKTTLARALNGVYFDIEQPAERLRLDLQWVDLLRSKQLVMLDEAQSWPELFVRLRGAIDTERQRRGRFLLLGSVSPTLMQHVSESLAGRLSIVELTPFQCDEVRDRPLQNLWLRGGFPEGGILSPRRFPQWQRDYIDLITQRDLPAWGLPAKPLVTKRFASMLAAVHGQTWNASQLGKSLGLSYHTVNSYVDFMEGAFLVRRLQPWFSNIKKRLVRTPKCYWRDSGLLHSLWGIEDTDDLLMHPSVGASWEGFVIEQILGALATAGQQVEPWYFRTSDGQEIDLLLHIGKRLWAIEAKLTAHPTPQDMSLLNRHADLVGADRRALVSQTIESIRGGDAMSCSLADFLRILLQ
jgi:predicted AAA+ superfamily ATPase